MSSAQVLHVLEAETADPAGIPGPMQIAETRISALLFAAASLTLAWAPVHWLVQSWTDPSYDSSGYVIAFAVIAIAMRSLLSGPVRDAAPGFAVALLVLAMAFRFLSQVLAINLLGGLALAVDVYALAHLAGLDRRPKPVSPFWLSALFLFSLPLEIVLERVLGFPLQLVSAQFACGILGTFFPGTECSGIRIGIAGQDVLVDLPCAGASGLLLLLAFVAGLNAVQRPSMTSAIGWGLVTIALAVLGNAFRISLLATGLVHGVDVLSEPLHSIIGLLTLAFSATPIVLFCRPRPAGPQHRFLHLGRALPPVVRVPGALAFFGLSFWIILQPSRPVDVSEFIVDQEMPSVIAGEVGQSLPLSPVEERYFTAYGGRAAKAQYGPLGLNRVSTTSPLRHLHSPEACLRGLGYKVAFLGTRHAPTPTSVYRATAPDGQSWLVSVSYVSDAGTVTASVGHAVWLWLNGQGGTWTSVQRITPISLPASARQAFDAAALAALDIPATVEPRT